MTKLNLSCILLLLLTTLSCSVEKTNISPIGDSFSSTNPKIAPYTLSEKKKLIVYSSEVSNLISSIPKFKNDAVNAEVLTLKTHLKHYLTGINTRNEKEIKSALKSYEKSYKKLQNLKNYLKQSENDVLNRYLVRLKTNMNLINTNISQD